MSVQKALFKFVFSSFFSWFERYSAYWESELRYSPIILPVTILSSVRYLIVLWKEFVCFFTESIELKLRVINVVATPIIIKTTRISINIITTNWNEICYY